MCVKYVTASEDFVLGDIFAPTTVEFDKRLYPNEINAQLKVILFEKHLMLNNYIIDDKSEEGRFISTETYNEVKNRYGKRFLNQLRK